MAAELVPFPVHRARPPAPGTGRYEPLARRSLAERADLASRRSHPFLRLLSGAPRRDGGLIAAIADAVALWARRSSRRRALRDELAAMPDEALADIGLTRERAWAEARKPFWAA
jgi:uncharacterized protein YjiS (DUF1127 family)